MMKQLGSWIVAFACAGWMIAGVPMATVAADDPRPTASERPGTDPALPRDVYASSRSRVPLITRDRITDEAGKRLYDTASNDPKSLVGLQGPGGIELYSPAFDSVARPLNQFLRFHTGLDRKLVEVAILTTAREMDQPFEWSAHEKAARAEGVSDATIDVVRNRKPTTGLDTKEAAIITLGREAIGKHKVSSATYATAQRLFGTEQLVNICAVMGDYLVTSVLLTTFDQQLPPNTSSTLPIP
jgi:4-carboxymuconolactone decarboxylase